MLSKRPSCQLSSRFSEQSLGYVCVKMPSLFREPPALRSELVELCRKSQEDAERAFPFFDFAVSIGPGLFSFQARHSST